MKRIFICLILISLSPVSYCQNQDTILAYSKVHNFSGLSKEKIYDGAMKWYSKYLTGTNYRNQLNLNDRAAGMLGGNKIITTSYTYVNKNGKEKDGVLYQVFDYHWLIECKDGKCRFSISNVFVKDVINYNKISSADMMGPGQSKITPPYRYPFFNEDVENISYVKSVSNFLLNLELENAALFNEISTMQDDF